MGCLWNDEEQRETDRSGCVWVLTLCWDRHHYRKARETAASITLEQNDKTSTFRFQPAQRKQQVLQEVERMLGPLQGQPPFMYHMALPCSCCGPKKLQPCSGIRHTLTSKTNHPTDPCSYDFSQHSISKGAVLQRNITCDLWNKMC